MNRSLILASGSPYRKQQLQQLGLTFAAQSPDIDESALPGEAPDALASRLALGKSRAISVGHPDAIIIGSDQVCACGHQVFGKPHTSERACQMLLGFSGKPVVFYTALCVMSDGQPVSEHIDETRVQFRTLTAAEVERYVAADQPLDCAGGFKVESRGLTLFSAIESTDPSALMGLPLIALCGALRQLGVRLP